VNGTLSIAVLAAGDVAKVELLLDNNVLTIWPAMTGSLSYAWDTTSAAEGGHALVARATGIDGTVVQSAGRSVIVDRTPPTIVSRLPQPGSFNADTLVPLTMTFSEPLAAATISNAGVAVTTTGTPATVTCSASLSADGKTLTLAPSSPLPPLPTTLTVSLTPMPTDFAGNALAPAANAWTFTVPAWIDLGDDILANAETWFLAEAPDGNLLVSYRARDTGQLIVERWNGKSWQPLAAQATPPGSVSVGNRALTVDANGQPSVLFDAAPTVNDPSALYAAHWNEAANSWEALGSAIITGEDRAVMATDQAGALYVAYTLSNGHSVDLWLVKWSGTAWTPLASPFNQRLADVLDPALTVDRSGEPMVAFREKSMTVLNAFLVVWGHDGGATEIDGNGPSGGVNAFGNADVAQPALVVDSSNQPILAFLEKDSATAATDLFAYRFENGFFNLIGTPPTSVGNDFGLAIDNLDRPVVLVHERTLPPLVFVWRWDGASRWQKLADQGVLIGPGAALGIDSHDRPIVAGGLGVKRSNQ
jgi:hypothetical protein